MSILWRVVRHPIIRQQGKFFAVGIAGTIIDFGIFNLLAFWVLHIHPILANTCSFSVAVAASFAMNRSWTFEMKGKVDWAREAVPFLVVSAIGWILQTGAIWVAQRWFSSGILVINAAKVLGVGAIWLVKFFVYRNYVFIERGALAESVTVEPG
jgi:putative flippase GtrA